MPLKHHQSDTPNHYSSKSTCQNILSWLSSYLPMRQLYLFQNLLSPKLVRVFQQQDLIKLVLQNISQMNFNLKRLFKSLSSLDLWKCRLWVIGVCKKIFKRFQNMNNLITFDYLKIYLDIVKICWIPRRHTLPL